MHTLKVELILTILICLIPLTVYAEQVDKVILPQFSEFDVMYIHKGMINGHHWKLLPEREKWSYLLGYQDGVINTAIYYVPDEDDKTEVISSFPSLPMDVLIKSIDVFYSNDKNLNIPIPYVLLVIRNRLIGTDEKDINKYIEHYRKSCSKERGER